MSATLANPEIHQALMKLEGWVSQSDWKAYDPFDGLSSPYASFLTLNRPFLKQVWQQAVRRCPINLRPLVGIKPGISSKAMGFFAQGYLRLYETSGEQRYLERARFCLDWLTEHRSPGFRGFCWGNHFDYQSRGGNIPKDAPTIVWTGLIAHAFLDAHDLLGEDRYFDVARSSCDFILDELGCMDVPGGICLRYYPGATNDIHNSNMIGASLLARVHACAPCPRYLDMAERAVQFTIQHQTPQGGWYYGVADRWKWIDSFHTGYVLEALDAFCRYSSSDRFGPALQTGYKFYIDTFFGQDGTPRYYDYKARPLDIQCASQGIQTLVNLRHLRPESVPTAVKVAQWTIANMQDPSGYFYYRKYPLITNKTPTLHWGQATMFAALALLNQHLRQQTGNPATVGTSRRATASGAEAGTAVAALPAQHVGGKLGSYVLITAARNEAEFIEKTIQSVISQTLRPARWVIVSDGSTDATDEIVGKYASLHSWIELFRMPERVDRSLAGKAHAFNTGWRRVQHLACDLIGNLDADISFDPDFFCFLVEKLAQDPKLGLVGTAFAEDGKTYDYRFVGLEHVSGQCQLFRRRCLEDIGGYRPVKGGGIDLVAVTTARMQGWRTRTFTEKSFEHHRPMGTAELGALRAKFRAGKKDYAFGGHPLWEVLRGGFQAKNRPLIIGGCMLLAGYFWSAVRRAERPVGWEFVRFRRRDQMRRLMALLRRGKHPGHHDGRGAVSGPEKASSSSGLARLPNEDFPSRM